MPSVLLYCRPRPTFPVVPFIALNITTSATASVPASTDISSTAGGHFGIPVSTGTNSHGTLQNDKKSQNPIWVTPFQTTNGYTQSNWPNPGGNAIDLINF